ncbi:hypothetical protein ACA910_006604 [Epithemia clementina (nom. ined.)]
MTTPRATRTTRIPSNAIAAAVNGDTNGSSESATATASSSDLPPSNQVFDVCICGAGPGGLLLASALAKMGVSSLAVVDPTLSEPSWPNNYGIWMDEACHFQYDDCVDRIWNDVGVVFDEHTPELTLKRPYGRVNRQALKARLLQECRHYAQQQSSSTTTTTTTSPNLFLANAKAISVQHFDDRPSQVTILQQQSAATQSSEEKDNDDKISDASSPTSTASSLSSTPKKSILHAFLVVDATGFARQFVKHNVPFDPGYQVTYGARFRVEHLGRFRDLNRMILMDYSEGHLHDNATLTQNNDRFPSFVYVMPLAPDEIFLEETILVSRPAGSSRDLQARLYQRLAVLGIPSPPLAILEDERAAIPMGGADPVIPQRTVGFGATSSLVHPASGYMVARAMELAPRVAQRITPWLSQVRRDYTARTKTTATATTSTKEIGASLTHISNEAWQAIWPADERRQRDFMHFGFELLCQLNPQELRDFFTGFFRLPAGLWQHFLSWRLSGIGHVVMGLTVWATCIPKRFMWPMLLKSMPFLPDKLIGPFLFQRQYPVFTESLYWDARTGNSTLWEPESFFPYVESLSQSYSSNAASNASPTSDATTTATTTTTTATLNTDSVGSTSMEENISEPPSTLATSLLQEPQTAVAPEEALL